MPLLPKKSCETLKILIQIHLINILISSLTKYLIVSGIIIRYYKSWGIIDRKYLHLLIKLFNSYSSKHKELHNRQTMLYLVRFLYLCLYVENTLFTLTACHVYMEYFLHKMFINGNHTQHEKIAMTIFTCHFI